MLAPGSLTRTAVALPLVFLLPGYTLLTAVFPYRPTRKNADERDRLQITLSERMALSFGLSIALTSLVAIGLTQIRPGFSVGLAIDGLSAVVLVFTLVGIVRRLAEPERTRFTLPISQWLDSTRQALHAVPEKNAVLSLALVGSAVLTFGTLGFVVTQPIDGSAYTGFQVVTTNDTGEPVAAEYPTELAPGKRANLTFIVRNNENNPVDYSVLVLHEQVSPNGTVTRSMVLKRFVQRVSSSQTWKRRHSITPPGPLDQSRITYLLYRGQPPSTPSAATAYRHLYLWLDEVDELNRGNTSVEDRGS